MHHDFGNDWRYSVLLTLAQHQLSVSHQGERKARLAQLPQNEEHNWCKNSCRGIDGGLRVLSSGFDLLRDKCLWTDCLNC